MEFEKYQHVEKFGNEEVLNIEIGTCYIFPKIDGTNGSIWIDKEGQLQGGSRNRKLALDNDNQGFFNWVSQQQNIKEFFLKYPHYRLYGEWLKPHTLKTYRSDAWNKFYVFDIIEEMEEGEFRYLTYEEYKPILDEYEIEYIPALKIIKNPTYEDLINVLNQNNYLVQDGQGVGEGIVIKNYSFVNKYDRTTWAKIITSEFKEKHYKEMGSPITERKMIEDEIIAEFCTSALIDKTYAKIAETGWSSKKIPELLNRVYHDLITEEIWEIIKKYKQPSINFKTLNVLTIQKIKEVKKELF